MNFQELFIEKEDFKNKKFITLKITKSYHKLSGQAKMNKFADCLEYINNYWEELTCYLPNDKDVHIGLPNPFISPSYDGGIFENDQFYWDSYFIILGLLESERVDLAKGMVENLAYLYRRFGIIPSRNRYYDLGVSQPPFLTSMILEVFNKTKDKKWLLNMSLIAEDELKNYWMDDKKVHKVYMNLSRYCDHWHTNLTAEHESGWDMTSRFNEKCLDFLPVDLNSLLYKYEIDLAEISGILGKEDKKEVYLRSAELRKKNINRLMWNEKKGFFFDYNFKMKKQRNFYSLAGFYPMWAGLATEEQAKRIVRKLKKFEYRWGLANTQSRGLSKRFKQWDYPNGWANQHWIVIKALLNYGFEEDARRIAEKWLNLNRKVFKRTGKFWEKYNVVKGRVGKEGRYPNQSGFGWTNAVFVKLVKLFF